MNVAMKWIVFIYNVFPIGSGGYASSEQVTDCSVVEESPPGTVLCDLQSIIDRLSMNDRIPVSHPYGSEPTVESGQTNRVRITVINEVHAFLVIGTQLTTRGRVDREQFISDKKCRQQRVHGPISGHQLDDVEEHSSAIDCIITLELAVTQDEDHAHPRFVHLLVRVRDINDHAPRFDQHSSGLWLEVDEDPAADMDSDSVAAHSMQLYAKSMGKPHREISVLPLAVDPDYAENGTLTYELAGPDAVHFELADEMFADKPQLVVSTFNAMQGRTKRLRLWCISELDYEVKTEYKLNLLAKDQCGLPECRLTTRLSITVSVNEVNEYTPRFHLEPTGEVSHAQTENRATPRHHPTVNVKQVEHPDRTSRILCIDVPENVPLGSKIYRFLAADKDHQKEGKKSSGSLKAVQYSMANGADLKVKRYFRLGTDDGWMTLIHLLDYESGPRYFDLVVLAVDTGRPARTGSLSVSIRVFDANDEAPTIQVRGFGSPRPTIGMDTQVLNPTYAISASAQSYTLSVKENSPVGTFIARISAADRDQGPAGQVSCSLRKFDDVSSKIANRPEDLLFSLQSVSSPELSLSHAPDFYHRPTALLDREANYLLLTNAVLDREEREWYSLTVICHDHGEEVKANTGSVNTPQRHTSSIIIKILLEDVNDNGPVFEVINYDVEVAENTIQGNRIVQIKATDPDLTKLTTTTRYRFASSEELKGSNMSNPMLLEEIKVYFTLEESSGWLLTGPSKLNREFKDEYIIPVVAFDEEFPNRTSIAWIHVRVTDKNDHVPVVVGNTTFWIDEEPSVPPEYAKAKSGSRQIFVGQLKTDDADLNENAQITYTILRSSQGQSTSGNEVRWTIRPDGSLFANPGPNTSLDREVEDTYLIVLLLTDQSTEYPLSSTTTLTVRLLDVNDNSPQFVHPSMADNQSSDARSHFNAFHVPSATVRLSEKASPGTLIYTAYATDADEGENGRVLYYVQPYEGLWQILHGRNSSRSPNPAADTYIVVDPHSGEIRLNKQLPLVDAHMQKKFVIFAEDCGNPSRRSSAFLYLNFYSSNDENDSQSRTLTKLFQRLIPNQTIENVQHSLDGKFSSGESLILESIRKPQTRSRESGRVNEHRRAPSISAVFNDPEWITGLGISLVIILLICLLFLVTYALNGAEIRKRNVKKHDNGPITNSKNGFPISDALGDAMPVVPNDSQEKGLFKCFPGIDKDIPETQLRDSTRMKIYCPTNQNSIMGDFSEPETKRTMNSLAKTFRNGSHFVYAEGCPLTYSNENETTSNVALRNPPNTYSRHRCPTTPTSMSKYEHWLCTTAVDSRTREPEYDQKTHLSHECSLCTDHFGESPSQSIYTVLPESGCPTDECCSPSCQATWRCLPTSLQSYKPVLNDHTPTVSRATDGRSPKQPTSDCILPPDPMNDRPLDTGLGGTVLCLKELVSQLPTDKLKPASGSKNIRPNLESQHSFV